MWIQTFDGDLVNGEFFQRIKQHYLNKYSIDGVSHIQLFAIMENERVLLDDSSTLGSDATQEDVDKYIENRLAFYLHQLNWKYL